MHGPARRIRHGAGRGAKLMRDESEALRHARAAYGLPRGL
jgi:hypothetical protein